MTEDETPEPPGSPEDWETIGEYYVEKKPDWMTETDLQILDALMRGLVLSPSIISTNTGKSREGISRRLNTLQAADYVEKVERGKYKITKDGHEFMEGRILPGDDDWKIDPDLDN